MGKYKRRGRFWVYILRCCDDTLYTGFTPDLGKRVLLHQSGRGAKYTRSRRPVALAWWKEYRYFKSAFMAERRIKRLPRRQKEKLIGGGQ